MLGFETFRSAAAMLAVAEILHPIRKVPSPLTGD
jgi:hypothetical protein